MKAMNKAAPIAALLLLLFASAVAKDLPRLLGTIRATSLQTRFGLRVAPLGDQNADGYDDFVTWDKYQRGLVFHGAPTIDTTPAFYLLDSLREAFDTVGDVNGDGYPDLAGMATKGGFGKMHVYFGGPAMDSYRDLWFGHDSLYSFPPFAQGYDLNANGTSELITWSKQNYNVLLFELTNPPDSNPDLVLWPANRRADIRVFGQGLALGDFNGDDTTDLMVGMAGDNWLTETGHVYVYWGGAGFDTIPDLIFSHPQGYIDDGTMFFGRVLVNLGDVSGDGYADLWASSRAAFGDTSAFIYFGGPDFDTLPDVVVPRPALVVKRAGDLNSDGYADFITSVPLEFTAGYVDVYLGGPYLDGSPFVEITNNDIDGFQIYFGRDIAGIGDYNGDGRDDFAFSAEDADFYGLIYIFSGWDGATDVKDDAGTLPVDCTLSQNYPNPFNPSTTIRFTVPTRSQVRLVVQNVLGQEVRRLIDSEVSAGEHEVEWDGTDESGREVASGTYLYRLITEAGEQTRKMVLVR